MSNKGVYEHQRAVTSDKRVYLLTRCAFAGQQRYAANTWSGDVMCNWETFRKQIPTQRFGMHRTCAEQAQPSRIAYSSSKSPAATPHHTTLNYRISYSK